MGLFDVDLGKLKRVMIFGAASVQPDNAAPKSSAPTGGGQVAQETWKDPAPKMLAEAWDWLDDPENARLAGGLAGGLIGAAAGSPTVGASVGATAAGAAQGAFGTKKPSATPAPSSVASDGVRLTEGLAVSSPFGWTVLIPAGTVVVYAATPEGSVAGDYVGNVREGVVSWERST